MKNIAIIIVLSIEGIGKILVSLFHIMVGSMAAWEWATILVIVIQISLLTIFYPCYGFFNKNISTTSFGDQPGA